MNRGCDRRGVGLDEPVGRRIGDRSQDDGRRCSRSHVLIDDAWEIHIGQHVTVEDDGSLVEERSRRS